MSRLTCCLLHDAEQQSLLCPSGCVLDLAPKLDDPRSPTTPTSIGRCLSWRARHCTVCRPIGVPGFSAQPHGLRVFVGRWMGMADWLEAVIRMLFFYEIATMTPKARF